MRSSNRYPGLKVEQLSDGLYSVEDRAGTRWIVYTDPDAHIGAAARWRATQRSSGQRLVAPTKDAIMRHIAGGSAADMVRIVA